MFEFSVSVDDGWTPVTSLTVDCAAKRLARSLKADLMLLECRPSKGGRGRRTQQSDLEDSNSEE